MERITQAPKFIETYKKQIHDSEASSRLDHAHMIARTDTGLARHPRVKTHYQDQAMPTRASPSGDDA